MTDPNRSRCRGETAPGVKGRASLLPAFLKPVPTQPLRRVRVGLAISVKWEMCLQTETEKKSRAIKVSGGGGEGGGEPSAGNEYPRCYCNQTVGGL